MNTPTIHLPRLSDVERTVRALHAMGFSYLGNDADRTWHDWLGGEHRDRIARGESTNGHLFLMAPAYMRGQAREPQAKWIKTNSILHFLAMARRFKAKHDQRAR